MAIISGCGSNGLMAMGPIRMRSVVIASFVNTANGSRPSSMPETQIPPIPLASASWPSAAMRSGELLDSRIRSTRMG